MTMAPSKLPKQDGTERREWGELACWTAPGKSRRTVPPSGRLTAGGRWHAHRSGGTEDRSREEEDAAAGLVQRGEKTSPPRH